MAEDRLTNEEAEQYDRQIRLWGLEAQKRLRTAKILMIGLGGLAAEVCKDIVLAGVKSLTIVDSKEVTDNDIANRFLCINKGMSRAECAISRLQPLNPNVLVKAESVDITEDYCQQFDLICATCCCCSELLRINEICRKHSIKFFCGDSWGYYGYFFTDLQEHSYAIDVTRNEEAIELDGTNRKQSTVEEAQVITEKRSIGARKEANTLGGLLPRFSLYKAFRDEVGRDPEVEFLEEDQKCLQRLHREVTNQLNISMELVKEDFVNYCFSELSPVCAIVGGVLGQEIIKAISANDVPFQNTFIYDGVLSTGIVEKLSS